MMKGSYLINEGDPVEGLSIVRDGLFDIKVRISNQLAHFQRDNALPQLITLSTIGPGEVISYDELVTGQQASSVTVKSKSNAEVWFIPKHKMGQLASKFQDEESLKLAKRVSEERKMVMHRRVQSNMSAIQHIQETTDQIKSMRRSLPDL